MVGGNVDQIAQYEIEVLIIEAGPVEIILRYQLERLGILTAITKTNLQTTN